MLGFGALAELPLAGDITTVTTPPPPPGPGANPNTLIADGTVLTPINPIPASQYGPSHWGSNAMIRQDDKPDYIYTEKPDAS